MDRDILNINENAGTNLKSARNIFLLKQNSILQYITCREDFIKIYNTCQPHNVTDLNKKVIL